jgi:hypothetical protein
MLARLSVLARRLDHGDRRMRSLRQAIVGWLSISKKWTVRYFSV